MIRNGNIRRISRRDETNLDDPRQARHHQRMSKCCVYFGGEHESLGVLGHGPACYDYDEAWYDVPLYSMLDVNLGGV